MIDESILMHSMNAMKGIVCMLLSCLLVQKYQTLKTPTLLLRHDGLFRKLPKRIILLADLSSVSSIRRVYIVGAFHNAGSWSPKIQTWRMARRHLVT